MTFEQVTYISSETGKEFRRTSWPSGVVGRVNEEGNLSYYHVAACALDPPPVEHLEKDDWIIVEDYAKDIGYDPFRSDS